MPSRNALAWLKRQKDDKLAVDEIDALVQTITEAEAVEARLATATAQVASAQAMLADIRAAAERENADRKKRIADARASIERAETEARDRVAAIERDHAQRLTLLRASNERAIAEARASADAAMTDVRESLAAERRLLSEITAKVEEARRELAPFMARG